jgi:hypothetical protein
MTNITTPFSGGCACGAIRYECSAEPIMMGKCHCRDCQHISGGAFVPFVIVPAEAFKVTQGEIQYHFTESLNRGKHKRGFCASCGSRLTGAGSRRLRKLSELSPAVWTIRAGFRPQMDIFISDAQPWDQMDPAIPKYEKYPPG